MKVTNPVSGASCLRKLETTDSTGAMNCVCVMYKGYFSVLSVKNTELWNMISPYVVGIYQRFGC